jgi:hypothetical protein
LNAGDLQVYFDADGKLKWGGGKGVADAAGISHTEDANNYWKVQPWASRFLEVVSNIGVNHAAIYGQEAAGYGVQGVVTSGYGIYGQATTGRGVYGYATSGYGVYGKATTGWGVMGESAAYGIAGLGTGIGSQGVAGVGEAYGVTGSISATGAGYGVAGLASKASDIGVLALAASPATIALQIDGGIVDGGLQRYTNLANWVAGTDALNKQSADLLYAPIAMATHNLLNAVHPDTTAAACVRGDIITGQGASPLWTRLAKGNQYSVLGMGANEPAWSGFLLDGTAGGKVNFAVTNGKVLTLTATDDYNATVPATGTVALATGIAGGQTVYGGTASGNNLTLSSTIHATKGKVLFGANSAYDEVNDRWGVKVLAPSSELDVGGDCEIASAGAYYLGDPTTDGSWRIIRSGNDLEFARRESGAWVTKGTVNA